MNNIKLILLINLSLLFLTACISEENTLSERVFIHTGWEFSQVGESEWRDAVVPGTVHQDLLAHELIPDPNYGENEKKVQWVENKDWEYRTVFTVTEQQLKYDGADLCFEGLDTYADVYLNDSLILKADNMFCAYSYSAKPLLQAGENKLRIYFHSPITTVMQRPAIDGFEYPADNDAGEHKLSVYSRKAPYHFGWDWGLRLVTSGIWRPVSVTYYDVAQIEDLYVKQEVLNDQKAELTAQVTVSSLKDEKITLKVAVTQDGSPLLFSQKCSLKKGKNLLSLPITISDPKKWMPNGWGKPVLYEVMASLLTSDKVLCQKTQRIGLRTVEVVTERDTLGESFYFKVNGIPMYAKGANYIPNDLLLPRVTDSVYQRTFDDVKASNMNIIRVWGGGVYEEDRFYDLADENGILVWQDFIFGCTPYPSDKDFLEKVEREAEYNIKRLRNHPSLAMWCGNNEILEALNFWGIKDRYPQSVIKEFFLGYDQLFRMLLPEKVMQLDSGRFYVHGSPYVANWGRSDLFNIRDVHDWGVWHGRMPFEAYAERKNRFSSEFGFQSFPEMKTIASFAQPEDFQIESDVMNVHQKSYIGNAAIKDYMERYYRMPSSFEDFVYVGLVMQGMGLNIGFEAQRRNRPYCMGTLYWQLNDCWPVVSWSSIDYYGNWKALQYQAKRAFAPLALSLVKETDTLACYVLSDELNRREKLVCRFTQISFTGSVLKEKELLVSEIQPNASTLLHKSALKEWNGQQQGRNSFLLTTLSDNEGNEVARKVFFFDYPKNLNLPKPTIEKNVDWQDGKCVLTLETDYLAKDVFVEIPLQGARFTDNFFDLLPGEKKQVVITSSALKKEQPVEIKIHHLRETYE